MTMIGGYQSNISNGSKTILFQDHTGGSVPSGSGNQEVTIGKTFILTDEMISVNEGIKISYNGTFRPFNNKTVRLYIGEEEIISNLNAPAPEGDYIVEAVLYRNTPYQAKGWATIRINNREGDVRAVNFLLADIDDPRGPMDKIVRITGQSGVEHPNSVSVFNFIIEKL